MQTYSVLIVENHIFTAEGLQTHLSACGFKVVGCARTADEGEKLAWAELPDLIILDLDLPDEPNHQRLLFQFCDQVPWKVAVLSSDERPVIVEECMRSGASAFLSKSEAPIKIMTVLKLILCGCSPITLTIDETVDSHKLSETEIDILQLLARGLKYQEIGITRGTSPETVRKQCDKMRNKLGLPSREHLMLWSARNGYAATC